MSSVFNWVEKMFATKHRLIAMSVLRVALGFYMLAFYAMHAFQYQLYWGDRGLVSFDSFKAAMLQSGDLSLFLFARSDLAGMALVLCGTIVTFAFTVGFKTRLSSILFFVFTWSVFKRDWYILNGGDNLLYILSFYLMFVDCGAFFSLDSTAISRANEPKPFSFRALLHNLGVTAIVVQLCILYLTSVFFKVQGHMWQDGTAIYYVLRSNQFNLTDLGRMLYHNAVLVTALTYSTLLFQAAWPWLIWNRYARPALAIGAIGLHLSIAYFMGLYWFSFVMIAAECVIFSDRDYFAFGRILDRIGEATLGLVKAWSSRMAPSPEQAP